jgi:isoleucyl-tRNA synthetase
MSAAAQDIVTRFASANGRHVIRRFGWDCHGLPVEYEIDKKLSKTANRSDIMLCIQPRVA